MEAHIEAIKSKLDIVEFLSQYIELKKSGRNFKALCPFHQEKSPSFVISPDRQIWHCFGTCGDGGDVIKFYMKWENLSFIEALRELAERTGVKIENISLQDDEAKRREKLYALNSLAARFYTYILHSTPYGKKGLEYLKNRGINDKIIQSFELGYAPQSWDSLLKFLQKKKFSQDDIIMSGLVVSNNGKVYDRFRNRMVFPIKDPRGNVIGFSGRLLDPDVKAAKYVNTPETPIYHKRESLYGIHLAKEAIRKEDNVYIVEGEFDMIYPFQKGVSNIVAIKGAALTKEQLTTLKRYTNKITLALDTDEAGIEAMKRGIREAEQFEFDIHVTRFSKGKDPDEAARADFITFKKELEEAMPLYDFLIEVAKEKYPEPTSFNKKKIGDELVPFIRNITNSIVQAHYVKKLATFLDVSTESIEKSLKTFRAPRTFRSSLLSKVKVIPRDEMLQKYLLSYIFQSPSPEKTAQKVFSVIAPEDFTIPAIQKIVTELTIFIAKDGTEITLDNFMKSLPSELRSVAEELFLYASGITDLENEKIWNIVYDIKETSCRRLYSYYSTRDDAESEKKAMYYKDLRTNLDKSELEKTFRTL